MIAQIPHMAFKIRSGYMHGVVAPESAAHNTFGMDVQPAENPLSQIAG